MGKTYIHLGKADHRHRDKQTKNSQRYIKQCNRHNYEFDEMAEKRIELKNKILDKDIKQQLDEL